MNKLKLAKQAQKLYEIENLNADEISERLRISRRTVFNWIKKYSCKTHRISITEIQSSFPIELQHLASTMINKVSADIDKGRKLSNEELSTIVNMVEHINKLEEKADKKVPDKTEKAKFLSPEAISQIQRDILGLNF